MLTDWPEEYRRPMFLAWLWESSHVVAVSEVLGVGVSCANHCVTVASYFLSLVVRWRIVHTMGAIVQILICWS